VDIEKFKKETFEKLERNNYQHQKGVIIRKNRLILATVFTLIIIPTIGFSPLYIAASEGHTEAGKRRREFPFIPLLYTFG
jgi:hypothetical protein